MTSMDQVLSWVVASVAALAVSVDFKARILRLPQTKATEGRFARIKGLSVGFLVGASLYGVCVIAYVGDLEQTARVAALGAACLPLLPYLGRSSPYRESPMGPQGFCVLLPKDCFRSVGDVQVWSSLLCFGVPSVYSFMVGQSSIGVLQLGAAVCSSLYHYARETLFFNADNIFGLSLGGTTFYAVYLAWKAQHDWYIIINAIAIPVAAFLLVYCNMPGVITKVGDKYKRVAHPRYPFWHAMWHLVSGFVTLLNTYYFARYYPDLDCAGSVEPWFPHPPTVAFWTVLGSTAINAIGNLVGFLPVD